MPIPMRKVRVRGWFGPSSALWRLAISGIALSAAIAQTPAHSPMEDEFPEGAGKQLVIQACQKCHTLNRIYDTDLWTYQWRDTVADMVRRGAVLDNDQAQTVIAYLAKNFRPSGPVRLRVVLPEGEGKAIITGDCQACHSLQKIVILRRSATDWDSLVHTMIRQGAKVRDEDIAIIVEYLTKNYGSLTSAQTSTP